MSVRTAGGLAAATLLVVAAACSNHKTPLPGKTCFLNSDCEDPLSCTFGKCHEACVGDSDCPGRGLCVYGSLPGAGDGAQMSVLDAGRVKVCVQETCALNSQCPDPLVCGRDLRCRQECDTKRDCPGANQLCVLGNDMGQKVCAEPPDIGDDGQLAPADGGVPPADGGGGHDAGDAAVPLSDGNVSEPPASDAPAPVNDGPAPASDARDSVEQGDAASPDAPVDVPAQDAGADALVTVPEHEPNDDKASPAPYIIGTEVAGTLGSGDGAVDLTDYYEVVAPATDPSGGYFQALVSKVGSGAVAAEVYSKSDSGRLLLADGADQGQDTTFFWAARPGQHYLVRLYVAGAVLPAYAYTFKATYTRIDDPYEPNDSSDTPTTIALGTPAAAYFFNGFSSAAAPTPDQDWYVVTLAQGPATVVIQPVPHDLRIQFQVYYEPTFVQVAATNFVGANAGAAITNGGFTASMPGRYLIEVSAFGFAAGSVAARGTVLPDSFTRGYTLTVTQP